MYKSSLWGPVVFSVAVKVVSQKMGTAQDSRT